ncbi:MAG TPA: alpha-amylase family glycosyl hydrolase, partial [Clostridia bacterium]
MISSVYSKEVNDTIDNARKAYLEGRSKVIDINDSKKSIPYPFHSPEDWRDCSIYFLMVDRFNNPKAPPKYRWNSICSDWQGGTINGVREQLQYIQELGLNSIWISPVLKQPNKSQWAAIYHGYGAQNFLEIDSRYGTDQDLIELIEEAHARGIYIILDIVLNHS